MANRFSDVFRLNEIILDTTSAVCLRVFMAVVNDELSKMRIDRLGRPLPNVTQRCART